jgi:uncharacterized membrane protein YeaQ/YmgE (transglycosylase-associated protein family)
MTSCCSTNPAFAGACKAQDLHLESCRVQCGRFGLILNIGVGILGAMLAGFLYGLLGLTTFGWTGALVAAVVGPLVLFLPVGMFERS